LHLDRLPGDKHIVHSVGAEHIVSSACAASFGVGYNNGGPVSIVWGWVLVSIMSLAVAVCMAEITSSLPISGGPYYW
jgi:amino acid transporter